MSRVEFRSGHVIFDLIFQIQKRCKRTDYQKKIVKAARLGQLGALTPPTMDLSVAGVISILVRLIHGYAPDTEMLSDG